MTSLMPGSVAAVLADEGDLAPPPPGAQKSLLGKRFTVSSGPSSSGAARSSSATSAGRRPDGPAHSLPLALRCASARRPAVDGPMDREGRAGDALIAPPAGPGLPAKTPSGGVPLTPPHHGATPAFPNNRVRRSQALRPCAVSAGWEGTLIATECVWIPGPSPRSRAACGVRW